MLVLDDMRVSDFGTLPLLLMHSRAQKTEKCTQGHSSRRIQFFPMESQIIVNLELLDQRGALCVSGSNNALKWFGAAFNE